MSSKSTQIRSIRLPNDVCEWIDRESSENPIRKVIESLYDKIQTWKITLKDGEILISKDSQTLVPPDIIADFSNLVKFYGIDFVDFFKILYRKIEDGEIDIGDIVK